MSQQNTSNIETRLNNIETKCGEIEKHLAQYNEQLKIHIEQSNSNAKKIRENSDSILTLKEKLKLISSIPAALKYIVYLIFLGASIYSIYSNFL